MGLGEAGGGWRRSGAGRGRGEAGLGEAEEEGEAGLHVVPPDGEEGDIGAENAFDVACAVAHQAMSDLGEISVRQKRKYERMPTEKEVLGKIARSDRDSRPTTVSARKRRVDGVSQGHSEADSEG